MSLRISLMRESLGARESSVNRYLNQKMKTIKIPTYIVATLVCVFFKTVVLVLIALTALPAIGVAQENQSKHGTSADESQSNRRPAAIPAEYDADVVRQLLATSQSHGDPSRGVMVFGSENFGCISCHKIGDQGGTVGPDLTTIRKTRTPERIVESILWPNRHVESEYKVTHVLTDDGRSQLGYKVREDEKTLVLRDPSSGKSIGINKSTIEVRRQTGSLMPAGVVSVMSVAQRSDLIRLLVSLGAEDAPPLKTISTLLMHAQAHRHGPATFEYDRAPLHPEDWPSWQEHVNRDRIYDFYAKQADHFRRHEHRPPLVQGYPGLDGGRQGHWGNQDEKWWADGRWKQSDLGSIQCGRLQAGKLRITRAVCLQLGGGVSACFNPDTLRYEAIWDGGFVTTSSRRHGLIGGLTPVGKLQEPPAQDQLDKPFVYRGYYRHGDRVVFSYRIGDQDYLDAPSLRDGKFHRVVALAEEHPLKHLTHGGPAQWKQRFRTEIKRGTAKPYAIDRIGLPFENPWKALIYCAGHDFLPDGTAVICTFQGDVWHVSNFSGTSKQATWRRYASGLSQTMGIVTVGKDVYVQGRDQITRLHDLNNDGEADFYECFSNAFYSSFAGHNFVCGLERDDAGNFYTVTNQGLIRVSPDGKRAKVIATGFRNPDGLGLLPDGTLTVPSSEGTWTPASLIGAVNPKTPNALAVSDAAGASIPHFGLGGPRKATPPNLPLVYLPRALDNSSGGQVYVSSDQWGPLKGRLLHFSYGRGSHFLVLRDKVGDFIQGAVVPLPGEFRSGAHRGRFSPHDGQLYVTGMTGWGTYATDDGCFDRVRYTGDRAQLPIGFHVHENGVMLRFSEPIDPTVAEQTKSQFAQCWNYRYGPAYGSPEFSSRHLRTLGHDVLAINSAHVLADRYTLFLEIPELQPVNQLHLYLRVDKGEPHEMFVTVHKLGAPFTKFPGYRPANKQIARHPMLADLASLGKAAQNPWRKPIQGARSISLPTGPNLTFARRSIRVKAGEPIKFTLVNPDVVPHNWVLVKPGSLERVGKLSNLLIADPDAFARHYVPESDDVLVHTNVVEPRTDSTVYFHAPKTPGRYPYLCTFPGHWMVMNGVMIVEEP